MPKIEGLNSLLKSLNKLAIDAKKAGVSVQVGFSQSYALVVHENTTAKHKVGQAKYLEAASRRHSKKIGKVAATVYKKTNSMEKALITGGLLLQREAQKLTPVDTGALKASAYTALDREAVAEAKKAFDRSEIIRKAGTKRSGNS
jgi:hypothetical protein